MSDTETTNTLTGPGPGTKAVMERIEEQVKRARKQHRRMVLSLDPVGRKILAEEDAKALKEWEAARRAAREAGEDAERRKAIREANKQKRAQEREAEVARAARKKAEQAAQCRGNG